MEREGPLDADTERLLPHGERLTETGSLTLDADALEHLDALPVALDDLEVHAQRVARLELRQVRAHVALLEALDDGVHRRGWPTYWPAGMVPVVTAIVLDCPRAESALAGSALAEGNAQRRPVGHEDLADDVVARHGAPHARVTRLRAVVAHDEVVVEGHTERLLGADVAAVVLDVRLVEAPPVDVHVRGAVAKPHLHALAGQADDPLHEGPSRAAFRLGGGRSLEHDQVATVWVVEVVDEAVREHAVRE